MNYFEMSPEKYFSWPSSYDKTRREDRLSQMVTSGNYMWSLKTDGNYSRFVLQNGEAKLQTRGISKKTGTYGEVQDKVFFFEDTVNAFSGDTVLLGEIYMPGCIDKDIGSILRCLTPKAIERQKKEKLRWRIFDVLSFDGESLMNTPLVERQEYIKKAVERINNPLVVGVKYYELNNTFYDELGKIFNAGGEGVVIYDKKGTPEPGKRTAWKTLKIKQEMAQDADCFIYGTEPAVRDYTGKEIETWRFWENLKTGEKLCGEYFSEYRLGQTNLEPISKGHYYGWPGAIYCAVWDENNAPLILCKCAGLTEEFKEELKNNYDKYHMMPIKITGMMVSDDNSIRHPKLISIRDTDIDVKDCTLAKIKG